MFGYAIILMLVAAVIGHSGLFILSAAIAAICLLLAVTDKLGDWLDAGEEKIRLWLRRQFYRP